MLELFNVPQSEVIHGWILKLFLNDALDRWTVSQ